MKLLTAFAVSSIAISAVFAPAAKALPIWATLPARSLCEYLAMGATFDQAANQALNDHRLVFTNHWKAATKNGLFNKTMMAANQQTCPHLFSKAWHQQTTTQRTNAI